MASIPDIPERYSWAWKEEPRSSHHATAGGKFKFASLQYFLAILCAVFAGIGFFVPAKEGPVVGFSVGVVFVILAIASIVWGIVTTLRVISIVDVYPSGVLWLQNGDWVGGRWEDLEVYVNGSLSKKHIGITTTDGQKAELHYFLSDWKTMADTIVMETTIRKVPEAMVRFDAGETIRFGDAAIDREGLKVGKNRYRFEDLTNIVLANGMIQLLKRGQKGICDAITFGSTPNYMVLLKLLDVSDASRVQVG